MEVMTTTLTNRAESREEGSGAQQGVLPFEVTATAYRRQACTSRLVLDEGSSVHPLLSMLCGHAPCAQKEAY